MSRQSLFGVGLQDKSLNVSAQRRLNLWLEFRPEDDGVRVVAHGTPGLAVPLVDFGDTPPRGLHSLGDFMYVVHRGTLWQVNNAGVATNRGTLLTTTGRVYFADNGTIIMIVDGQFGYTFNTGTNAFAQIVSANFNAGNSVTWQDRYFIYDKVNSGRFYISALDDPSTWSALDFANAEASPDNLVRVMADHGELILFGDLTIEFWGNSGAADFPYVRLGSSAVEWGLAARESLVKFETSLAFLGKNRMGEAQVVVLNGYTPQNVGSQDFLDAINKYATLSDATAFSYMQNGHAFYQINFPTANKSWLYDGGTKVWSEVGYDNSRHRGNMSTLFLGKTYVADYSNGRIYKLDPTSFTDNGTSIPRELISRHLAGDNYIPISQLWVDMETGVGTTSGQGSDPQVMLACSNDFGHSYGPEIWRSAGPLGNYGWRAWWNRLGSDYQWTFKLRITDPVKVAIKGDGYVQ